MRQTTKQSICALAAALILSACGNDDSGLQPVEGLQPLASPNSAPSPKQEKDAQPKPIPAPRKSMPNKAVTPQPVVRAIPQKSPQHFPVKRCMNMGNALEAEKEGAWGYTIQAEHFSQIRRAGFDTVRIPIRWDIHTQDRPPHQVAPAFLARVKAVTAQAQRAGLGVILDVHHYETLMKSPGGETAKFLAIWEQISAAFEGAPENIYFEILNEPMAPMTMDDANRLYARILPIIRKHHPKRAVIMGGDQWNSIETMEDVNWPNDPYLVATFHDYGPYEFTHQGATWLSDAPPTGRAWGGKADQQELKETYDIARRFKRKTGLPVFVGEFGVVESAPHSERIRWIEMRRKTMENEGMSWCVWDFAGAFKTYDVEKRQWLPGMREALTGP